MSNLKSDQKKSLLIKIEPRLHTNLKILAALKKTDMTTIVVELIEDYIEDQAGKSPEK